MSRPLPGLSGQAIRQRKRDEKVKFEPTVFRDEIVDHINSCSNMEEVQSALIQKGTDLDYRRYSEQLLDIFIAGGMLAPGGSVIDGKDGDLSKFCVFASNGNDDEIRAYIEILNQIIQRFKYLFVSLEEQMEKMLKFIKAFTSENREKFAKFLAFLNFLEMCPAKVLESIFMESLTRDDTAEKFMAIYFQTWLHNSNVTQLATTFKKYKLDKRLEELFPANKRSFEYMRERFESYEGLDEIISWQLSLRTASVKKELQTELIEKINQDAPEEELIQRTNEVMTEKGLKPVDMVPVFLSTNVMSFRGKLNSYLFQGLLKFHDEVSGVEFNHYFASYVKVFSAIVTAVSWNKKFDLMTEQALKQLAKYNKLFRAFAQTAAAQVVLLLRLQSYCVDQNMPLMKIFAKMVLLLYKMRVVDEDAILEWYHEKHSNKGKTILLPVMEPMILWLSTAQEGMCTDQFALASSHTIAIFSGALLTYSSSS
eukprot:gene178-3567_t